MYGTIGLMPGLVPIPLPDLLARSIDEAATIASNERFVRAGGAPSRNAEG